MDNWAPDNWAPRQLGTGQLGTGQLGTRTIGYQDNRATGQLGTRTIGQLGTGQLGTRTNGHQNNCAPEQLGTRIIGHHDNWAPGQLGTRQLGTRTTGLNYKMKLLPQAFDNIFQARNINHSYGSITTRTNSDFLSKFCRISITKQSMQYKGPLAWAQVPSHLKHSKLLSKSFLSKLGAHVLNAPINSLPS